MDLETSIEDRVWADIDAEYQYAPAPGPTPSVTSVERQLADGTSVADVTVAWFVDRGPIFFDVSVAPTGGQEILYTDLLTSPLLLHTQPTNQELQVKVRVKHRVSNVAGDWGPTVVHTTAQDTGIPDTPAGTSGILSAATGRPFVKWNPSTSPDYKETVVYRGTSPNPTSELVRVSANGYEDLGATPGQATHYRMKHGDKSGNLSEYSANVGPLSPIYVARDFRLFNVNVADGDPPGSWATVPGGSATITIPTGAKYLWYVHEYMNPSQSPHPAESVSFRWKITAGANVAYSHEYTLTWMADDTSPKTVGYMFAHPDSGALNANFWGSGRTFEVQWRDNNGTTTPYHASWSQGTQDRWMAYTFN